MKHNLYIGITGSIGAGKSAVSNIFEKFGVPVLYSDRIAKELMVSNSGIITKLKEEFGERVYYLDENNKLQINKQFFADIIFKDKNKLDKANSIIHPVTIAETNFRMQQLFIQGIGLVANESALIYEAGFEDRFDYIIVVDAEKNIRYERAAKRDGVKSQDILQRELNQFDSKQKVKLADFVIYNNGNLSELEANTKLIYQIISNLPTRRLLEKSNEIMLDETEDEDDFFN